MSLEQSEVLSESTEEKVINDQYAKLHTAGGLAFNRLSETLPGGVVLNTIYVEKTPHPGKSYLSALERLRLKGELMLGMLWLVRHPLLALHVDELEAFNLIHKRNATNLIDEITDYINLDRGDWQWPEEAQLGLSLLRSGVLTVGSTHAFVLEDVVYTPLWPTHIVEEEGRFGPWGSAVLVKES